MFLHHFYHDQNRFQFKVNLVQIKKCQSNTIVQICNLIREETTIQVITFLSTKSFPFLNVILQLTALNTETQMKKTPSYLIISEVHTASALQNAEQSTKTFIWRNL